MTTSIETIMKETEMLAALTSKTDLKIFKGPTNGKVARTTGQWCHRIFYQQNVCAKP
jgi:hypothetical protein